MRPSFYLLRPFSIVLILLGLSASTFAQGAQSDYDRAAALSKTLANKVFGDRVRPNWLEGNAKFWYRNDLANEAGEYILVDAEAGTRKPAFNAARLAESLTKAAGKEVKPERLGIDRLRFNNAATEIRFNLEGKRYRCDLASYVVEEVTGENVPAESLPAQRRLRPSRETGPETWITFVNRCGFEVEIYWNDESGERKHYATIPAGGQYRQHTFAGHVWFATDKQDRRLAVFVATTEAGDAVITEQTQNEEPRDQGPRPGRQRGESPDGKCTAFLKDNNVWLRNIENKEKTALTTDGTAEDGFPRELLWSPDSKKLVAMRVRKGEDRKVLLVESAPKDQLQPKLHTIDYPKPGDRIDQPRPFLFDIESKKAVDVPNGIFATPWSIEDLRWSADSSRFTFVYNQRGHQVVRLVAVDAASGAARAVADESPKTFVDYTNKLFCFWLGDDELVWMSERSGWNHLYLIDAKTGSVKNAITKGEWVVRRIERIDAEKRQAWFWAGGIRPEQDPYYLHLCRVNLDGTGLVILTEGDGTHEVTFSPDGRFFIDRYSRVDLPPVTELRRSDDGKKVCELERADATALLAMGWRAPERFVAKGRDGRTDIYGIILRPMNFDENKKYPVIEDIYAGPQAAFVPKAFGLGTKQRSLAELGFVIVQIDGMGTNFRSKAFHDVCWKNLGDSGFPDRILWIKAAAAKYPQMDLTRVGLYGGSAGGQSALRGLLAYGDFYKAGAADCGCHDNRMDKIWWNEQWMGWPIGPHYQEQSNVTQAHRLTGKLLLTVGELDSNVDPASTMQVVNALIKADKDFELVIFPGSNHGSGESPYGIRRRMDFFVRNLLGVEPRRN